MMTCKICSHLRRAEIERSIVEQRSLRDIAKQFGLHSSSVNRHKKHIQKSLIKAKQGAEVSEATTLLSDVVRFKASFEEAYQNAVDGGEWTGAAAMARQMLSCVELLGKLSGELRQAGSKVATSVGIDDPNPLGKMTDDELDREILALLCSTGGLVKGIRQSLLYNNGTVPPGLGHEAKNRCNDQGRQRDE